MKVVYAKTTAELVDAAIQYASDCGKKIDRIILTPDEWSGFCFLQGSYYSAKEFRYKGVSIIKEGSTYDVNP